MNNISFKAKFEGMECGIVKQIFENKTKKDTKHEIVFTKGNDVYGNDKFELFNDGVKTAEYKTEIMNEQAFSINRLMGIFNILKAKEAQAKIEEMKNKK